MNSQSDLSPSSYVDMDVHKDSIDIAAADAGRDSDVRHLVGKKKGLPFLGNRKAGDLTPTT